MPENAFHKMRTDEIIQRDIELEILRGTYKPNSKIPSVNQLSSLYGIGRATAYKVTTNLANNGVIVRKIGSGCYVNTFTQNSLIEQFGFLLTEYALLFSEIAISLGYSYEASVNIINEAWLKYSLSKEKISE